MRSHLWIVVALAACAKDAAPKDDGRAGATTGEAAVRGLVEALLAGDVERARRYLPDEAACEGAPPAHRTPCLENGRMMRAQIGDLVDDFPAGAKLVKVERSPDAPPAPELGMWRLTFDGADPAELMTVEIGDRSYAAFAIRKPR